MFLVRRVKILSPSPFTDLPKRYRPFLFHTAPTSYPDLNGPGFAAWYCADREYLLSGALVRKARFRNLQGWSEAQERRHPDALRAEQDCE